MKKINRGYTLLHDAVYHNKIEIVRLLLTRRLNGQLATDINSRNEELTPLCSAIMNKNIEIIKLLLESGANPNTKHHYGRGLIHLTSDQQIIELLLRYGLNINDVDIMGVTALYSAVMKQGFNFIQYLLEHKADPNIATSNDDTPLKYAIRYRFYGLVQILLDHGAWFDDIQTDDPKVLDLFEYYRVDIKEPVCVVETTV